MIYLIPSKSFQSAIFLLFIKIFLFLSFTFGHGKNGMYFFMLYIFGGTNCIKNLYTCTVEYFTGLFFQVYFNCDALHSFTVMDIFIFVLDMQSLHCLKIFTFLCLYLVDLFFTVKKSIFNRYFLLSVLIY